MRAIVFVTTAWGSRFGGINAFNADLCVAVSRLCGPDAGVICCVLSATEQDVRDALDQGVRLISLGGDASTRDDVEEYRAYQMVHLAGTWADTDVLWWVGHDVVSGPVATAAAQQSRARSAVIQHTDYPSYAPLKGSAGRKVVSRYSGEVENLLEADAVFGVGPKLAAGARDRLRSRSEHLPVTELVPGLANIAPLRVGPSHFRAITFGRLDPVTDRIKQGKLAVEAFGRMIGEAADIVGPDPLMTVIGVSEEGDEQNELKRIAARQAGRAVSVIGHPYTDARKTLFDVLRESTVCLMLSLHEGFGLTGWEAIAAEVPLIVSKNTGLYEFLNGFGGSARGCVRGVDVRGSPDEPFYVEADIRSVAAELRSIARGPELAKRDAQELRRLLSARCTWAATAREFLDALQFQDSAERSSLGNDLGGASVLPPSNLRPTPSVLIGRDAELKTCKDVLLNGPVQLLTIIGPGGAGKTRFAQELGRDLRTAFDDHVYFVDLTSVTDPNLVVATITRALRFEPRDPILEALKELLRIQRVLLVLDNFEQVLRAAPVVADLVEAARGLHVIATSREPLRVDPEREFRLPDLGANEAAQLFTQRAELARDRVPLDTGDQGAVAALCARLDRLPLAIELVAARTKYFAPPVLLELLKASTLDLSDRTHRAPSRHTSLRSTIAWSYHLLDIPEQQLFRRLSVFVGGCTLKTGAAVLSRDGKPDLALADQMSSLVEKSLLRAEGIRGSHRFRMLETLREFADEQLQHAGETQEIRRRHAEYFLSVAEQAQPDLIGPRQGERIEELESEQENLAAALDTLLELGAAEQALTLGAVLGQLWWSRGDYAHGWLRLRDVIRDTSPHVSSLARAGALNWAGKLAIRLGRLADAENVFNESRAIADARANRRASAEALDNLALVAMERADFETARRVFDEALTIHRDQADLHGTAETLDGLGVAFTGLGDHAGARRLLVDSLEAYRRLEDAQGAGWVLNDLARLALVEDDLARAEEDASSALAAGQRLGDTAMIAWARNYLGIVAARRGDYDRSREYHRDSLGVLILLGDKRPIALAFEGFAGLAAEQQEWRRAFTIAGFADALRSAAGIPRTRAEQRILDRRLDRARESLGQPEADEARTEGKKMSLEQAVAFARND